MSITSSKSSAEHSIIYSDMRGVDFSSDGSGISPKRFAYLENMYRDYEADGAGITESIPGFRKIFSAGERINGIFRHRAEDGSIHIVVHAADKLYRFPLAEIDTLGTLTPIGSIKDTTSRAIAHGSQLLILDGESIHVIDGAGSHSKLCSDIEGYIPTTYYAAEEYEQRNLLSNKFYEKFIVGSPLSCSFGSEELIYRITDEENAQCSVLGASSALNGKIYVPATTVIGDKRYTVTGIDNYAFADMRNITSVFCAGGVRRVGKFAFSKCYGLKSVILPDCIENVDNYAFDSCEQLSEIHLGAALSRLGNSAFSFCSSLNEISYGGSESDFELVENTGVIGERSIIYEQTHDEILLKIPVYSPAASIESLELSDAPMEFTVHMKNNTVDYVTLFLPHRDEATGRVIRLLGTLPERCEDYAGHSGFISSSIYENKCDRLSIISGCTLAECFDGRIFLAGNPLFPNTCFYSGRMDDGSINPYYFGELNYFCDGIGPYPIIELLSTADSLAVFKAADDGGGSIFYHAPHETGVDLIPKIYPTEYIHSGIHASGRAISFFDDPVFISDLGLCALDKKQINLQRSIAIRSHNVNPKLLCEKLSDAALAVWRGYLAILCEGRIYLADSRATFTHETGNKEYEWYYLNGIGSYSLDDRVYRFSSICPDGYTVIPELCGKRCEGEVLSATDSNGEAIYFTIYDGKKVALYPTDEFIGGIFSPARVMLSTDNRLLFGTDSGDVCIFNNDKRGEPPPSLSNDEGFSYEEYKRSFSLLIHPKYYSFDRHAPRYALKSATENCGTPNLTKNSVKGSLGIKCKSYTSGDIICEVGTDRTGYREICRIPGGALSFADLDFSAISLDTGESFTLRIDERSRRWIEKKISIYSDEFECPLGIYSISYRYKIRGKLKKNF